MGLFFELATPFKSFKTRFPFFGKTFSKRESWAKKLVQRATSSNLFNHSFL
jgi:hypothetical protein